MKAEQNVNSKNRKYIILLRLLNGEHLSYQRLSDEYLVSRSSIANDIGSIKKILSEDNLVLTFDNSGTFLDGGEIAKQRVLKRLIVDLVNELNTNMLLPLFLNDELYRKIKKIFQDILQKSSLEVPESYLQDILISTVIVIQRGLSGSHVVLSDKGQFGSLFFQFDKYPLVYELLKKIESSNIYKFNDSEFRYLSYVILGNGFKYFMTNATIPNSFKLKVKNLINKVSNGIGIDLSQDTRLESDLLIHLYQLVLRLQAHTSVVNPLLSDIKKNYRKLFGVVWYALNDFGSDNDLKISADEVGFVTIHFQAALERNKKVKKILFVCPNGIGTSSFITAKLRRILPDVTLIEIVSSHNLNKIDLSDVDLIISTVDVEPDSVPVVKISPIVTTDDIRKVMSKYIDITLEQSNKEIVNDDGSLLPTVDKLKGHVFFGNINTPEEAITFLQDKNVWNSEERKKKFKLSVIKREEIQSTYLGNGFAIPHGNPSLVDKTNISILILDKPIYWGTAKVDVVALLMIQKNDNAYIEPFMNLLMKGIEDKSWFISKMMEVK
ncbi:BglG family transcription antiterminator [Companilactobacillus sp. HBUAS59544]|uniref:BglG family transcription antiterminator n=1 Tax=Companilactobacillus sp. HBUAS59544 TaxID=3109363 RepID=UPI002FEF22F4